MAGEPAASVGATRAGLLLAGAMLLFAWPDTGAVGFEVCAEPGFASTAAGGDGIPRVVCSATADRRLDRGANAEDLLFGGRLDLNRASARALEALPSIGPNRARAIVAARRRDRFEGVSDLARIRGIGPRTVEAVEPWVEVKPLVRRREIGR